MKEFQYTLDDVRAMWGRPYEEQIAVMQAKILDAVRRTDGGIAVSYSGGKDSGMLLEQAAKCWAMVYGDSRPLVVIWANTGCEFKSMWPFVQRFTHCLEDRHGIRIDLRCVSAKQPFARTIREIGYPFPSKKIARMVSDVRAQMQALGVRYDEIKPYIHGGLPAARAMRERGFSAVVVCDVTGIKSDGKPGTCVIPARWAPLLGAPFEVSHRCCQVHKKGPIRTIERELGGLMPMVGEMAANSKTRLDSYRRTGCNQFGGGKRVSKPMGPMTEQTVNRYYYETGLPLAPPYGEPVRADGGYRFSGEQNTGCKLCGFGIMYDWDRFVRLAKLEPETVRWAFKPLEGGGLGYGTVCRYINEYCGGKIALPDVQGG